MLRIKNILEICLCNFRKALSTNQKLTFLESFAQIKSKNFFILMKFLEEISSESQDLGILELFRIENILKDSKKSMTHFNKRKILIFEDDKNITYFRKMNRLNELAITPELEKRYTSTLKFFVKSAFKTLAPQKKEIKSLKFCLTAQKFLDKMGLQWENHNSGDLAVMVNDVVGNLLARVKNLKTNEVIFLLECYSSLEKSILGPNHIFLEFDRNYQKFLDELTFKFIAETLRIKKSAQHKKIFETVEKKSGENIEKKIFYGQIMSLPQKSKIFHLRNLLTLANLLNFPHRNFSELIIEMYLNWDLQFASLAENPNFTEINSKFLKLRSNLRQKEASLPPEKFENIFPQEISKINVYKSKLADLQKETRFGFPDFDFFVKFFHFKANKIYFLKNNFPDLFEASRSKIKTDFLSFLKDYSGSLENCSKIVSPVSLSEIIHILFSLSILYDSDEIPEILRELKIFLDRASFPSQISKVEKSMLYSIKMNFPNFFTAEESEFVDQIRISEIFSKKPILSVHNEKIKSGLKKLKIGFEEEVVVQGLQVDFLVFRENEGVREEKVLEVQGNSHYFRNERCLFGKNWLKEKMVRKLGYEVCFLDVRDIEGKSQDEILEILGKVLGWEMQID